MVVIFEKLLDPLFDDWKKMLKKANDIGFINWLFIVSLLILWSDTKTNIEINILGVNIIKILNNLYAKFYSSNFAANELKISFGIIIVIYVMVSINKIYEKTFYKLEPTEKINGMEINYNPITAINKVIRLNFYYFHDIWISFFFINILSNSKSINIQFFHGMSSDNLYTTSLFWLNIIILIFACIKDIFTFETTTEFIGKTIEYKQLFYVHIAYKKISGEEFLILKDTIMKPNLFYLIKVEEGSLDEAKIIDWSKSLDEIKYHFSELDSVQEERNGRVTSYGNFRFKRKELK